MNRYIYSHSIFNNIFFGRLKNYVMQLLGFSVQTVENSEQGNGTDQHPKRAEEP